MSSMIKGDVPGPEFGASPFSNLPPLEAISEFGMPADETGYEDSDESLDPLLPKGFNDNLAEDLPESVLSSIASKLLDEIADDLESRREWEQFNEKGIKLLGIKPEEARDVPFMRACSVVDSTLATAYLRSYAIFRAELFPNEGPARLQIMGNTNPEAEQKGESIIDMMNYYLTHEDRDYYTDSEKLLINTILFGNCVRKVYLDPITKDPMSRMIHPYDFIVDDDRLSLLDTNRITQVIYLTKKDVILRQLSGDFLYTELSEYNDSDESETSPIKKTIQKNAGIDPDSHEKKSLYKFYEVHTNLDIDELNEEFNSESIPLPYIITIDVSKKKIVSIRRNWEEGDKDFKRIQYFVLYQYLPDFGIYGVGLARLLGSDAIALTSIERQLIDAATLKSFPGGLKVKGSTRLENNDKAIGPSEFRDIETGGLPIRDCIMPMPYAEPSSVLYQMYKDTRQAAMDRAAVNELNISEQSHTAPVGTTLALIEMNGRQQSSILRSLHVSLGQELNLLYKLFQKNIGDVPFVMSLPGKEINIDKSFFTNNIKIIPVSDPDMMTTPHRILRSEAEMKIANSAPQMHDMHEVYYRMYSSMGVKNIDKILMPKPQPLSVDAITENMEMLQGKPVIVNLSQDDDAHILLHGSFAQQQAGNPQVYVAIMEHNQNHKIQKCLKMLIQEQAIDPMIAQNLMQMPIDQLRNIPELQNMVSKMDAEELMQQMKQMQEMQAQQKAPIDPNTVMMADIEQKKVAAELKHQEVQQKAETEAFKATMKYDTDMKKMEIEQDIAEQKNETDLEIAQMKAQKVIK